MMLVAISLLAFISLQNKKLKGTVEKYKNKNIKTVFSVHTNYNCHNVY